MKESRWSPAAAITGGAKRHPSGRPPGAVDSGILPLFVGLAAPSARRANEGCVAATGRGDNVPYNTPSQRFGYRPGDLNPRWHLADAKVIVYHFWTDTHLPIESIDDDSHIVTFQHKSGKRFTDDFSGDGARYIVENLFEALDAPGEWYLDRSKGVLYYRPLPGETMETAEVIAPVTRRCRSRRPSAGACRAMVRLSLCIRSGS